jgi:hypothetical protein
MCGRLLPQHHVDLLWHSAASVGFFASSRRLVFVRAASLGGRQAVPL